MTGSRPALLGAAVLAALALRAVPWSAGLAAPATPFDRSGNRFLSSAYALLRDAGTRVPAGASAVILSEPRDPAREFQLFQLGLSLLPGRDVRPAALVASFTPPETWGAADYRIVIGRQPVSPGDVLVLATPSGTVWRRGR